MKRILWFIFSLALILGVLLSANLAEGLASFKNIGIIEGDRASIIEGDLCPRSARIIEGGSSRSAGTLEGDVVPSI